MAGYGSRLDELQSLDGKPAGNDLFDGIDTSWGRWWEMSNAGIRGQVDKIIYGFNPLMPASSVPALVTLRDVLTGALAVQNHADDTDRVVGREKLRQLDRILAACLGLYVQTTVPQAEVVPGETLKLTHAAMVGADFPVRWQAVVYPDGSREEVAADLHANRPVTRESARPLPVNVPLGQPYWLREEGTPGMYRVDDPALIGKPENPPAFPVAFVFEISRQELTVPAVPVQLSADPAKGEVQRQLKSFRRFRSRRRGTWNYSRRMPRSP